MSDESLSIALPKGRILGETLDLLERADIRPAQDPEASRHLVLQTNRPGLLLAVVRSLDVVTYVEHGAADLGIVGRDLLLEYTGDNLCAPLDLGIGICRMVLAAPSDGHLLNRRLRVATKYVQSTRRHFIRGNRQAEIIHLYGAIELAPRLGMADCVVDLMATGRTLQANGLVVLEKLADISARLIVNRAALKTRYARIRPLIRKLEQAAKQTKSGVAA